MTAPTEKGAPGVISVNPWLEQQEKMWKDWASTATKNWDDWIHTWQSHAAPGAATWGLEFYKQWIRTLEGTLGQAAQQVPPGVGPDVFTKMLGSAQVYGKLLELWTGALEPLLVRSPGPLTEEEIRAAQERWNQAYQSVLTTVFGAPPSPESAAAIKAWGNMVSENLTAAAQFFQPLWQAAEGGPEIAEHALRGDAKGLLEGYGILRKSYQQTFGKLLHLPSFGYFREISERFNQAMSAYFDFLTAFNEYQMLLFQTANKASDKMFHRLRELKLQGWDTDSFKTLYTAWWTINENTFHELFHTEDFLGLLREVLNRGLRFRQWSDAFTDKILEMLSLPTRKDFEEVYKTLFDLRKEVRWQRRAIRELQERAGVEEKLY